MATGTAVDVVMPQMGVSVSEGTITKWLKSEGEEIAADEALLEISTDKVDTEIPSPASGVVQQILAQEGETVAVGTKIAVIAPEGEAAEAPEAPPEPATAQAAQETDAAGGAEGGTPTAEKVEEAREAEPEAAETMETPPEPATAQAAQESDAAAGAEGVVTEAEPETAETAEATPEPASEAQAAPEPVAAAPEPVAAAPEPDGDGRPEGKFVSPVVARIAAEHDVDVSQIEGTGRGGRVTKKDILKHIESGPAQAPAAPVEEEAQAPAAPAPQSQPPAPTAAPAAAPAGVGETVEPMSAMRKGIAEHMRRSLDTSAHVTSSIEVDMTKIASLRQKLKKEWAGAYGVNPTYLAFVARAVVETLKDYPWINGEIRGDSIVTRQFVNLGFAVELADGKGLIVPVVKNAETLNLLGIAKAIADVAKRARDKQLLPDDVQGGTFTITNPGGYGTFHGTPVISQPQAAILGTYAVVKRPWVVEDELGEDAIAIRSIMNVTLTYDHRLVDGALAGRFLRDLRERLETWDESAE
jgi:pyruvate dehydrogenase E2 component (dihydrolipoamide acetyltransferase)